MRHTCGLPGTGSPLSSTHLTLHRLALPRSLDISATSQLLDTFLQRSTAQMRSGEFVQHAHALLATPIAARASKLMALYICTPACRRHHRQRRRHHAPRTRWRGPDGQRPRHLAAQLPGGCALHWELHCWACVCVICRIWGGQQPSNQGSGHSTPCHTLHTPACTPCCNPTHNTGARPLIASAPAPAVAMLCRALASIQAGPATGLSAAWLQELQAAAVARTSVDHK